MDETWLKVFAAIGMVTVFVVVVGTLDILWRHKAEVLQRVLGAAFALFIVGCMAFAALGFFAGDWELLVQSVGILGVVSIAINRFCYWLEKREERNSAL